MLVSPRKQIENDEFQFEWTGTGFLEEENFGWLADTGRGKLASNSQRQHNLYKF